MDDDELMRQFESRSLSFDIWRRHRTHAKVAFLHLRKYSFDDALQKVRAGIKDINAKNHVPDGPLEGYNETTTHALMRLIHATMKAYGEVFPTPNADAFFETHPQLATKHVLRCFYSPQRREHPDAKRQFVEPDLAPLPCVD
jgi:hypothetical protein